MSVITVKDGGGQVMTLFQHNGFNCGNYPFKESITNVHTLPIRDDDVFICSYPKSGTHWLLDTVSMIRAGQILHDTPPLDVCSMEYAQRDQVNDLSSPRVLHSHFKLQRLPPDILKKGCKIIYMIRNPKDVAVSYYTYISHVDFYNYDGQWKDYLEPFALGKFAFGSWFDHVLSWEEEKKKHPTISIIYFEDLKEDPLQEIRKLDKILGTERSEEFLTQVCDFTSFSKMRQRKLSSSLESPSSDVIYRKGEVGDWRNWFTVAQNEWFDKLYWDRMKGSDLKIRFHID